MSQSKILLEVGTNELEIVEFFINERDGYRGYYGINVSKVVEIIRTQPVTAMPQMRHPSVLGAFPYRGGRIVPLIDVCKYLDKGSIGDESKIIITEFNNVQTAFLVSGVTRIHRISWKQVEAPSRFLMEMSRGSITGMVRLEDRVVFVLDMEAIVATLHPALSIRMDEKDEEAPLPPRKFHIIHADDSNSIRRLVYSKLEKDGRFDVTQVTDGEEAWNLMQKYKQEAEETKKSVTDFVQGIISDIEMPNMDGLTLCRRLKEDPVLRAVPIAMFSSLISPSLARKCENVGADAQFAKPDLQAISDKMYDLIQSSRA